MAFPDARAAVTALSERTATLADLREIVTAFPQLRPVVAAYPETDAALLGWLAGLQDPLVDAQLAKRQAGTANLASQPRFDAATDATIVVPRAPAAPGPTGWGAAAQPASAVFTPAQSQPGQPQPPAGPQPSTERRKRSTWPLVVGLVVLLGLIGGGLGAAFATGLLGGGSTSASSAKPAGTRSSAPVSASAQPSDEPSASTEPVESSAAAANFVCWDGTESAISDECRDPHDKDTYWSYLKYAYPSIATHPDCERVDSTGKSTYTGITVMWECELGDALIRYRYWEETDDAETHYAKKFSAKTTLKTYDVLIGGEPVEGWVKTDKDTVDGPDGVKRVVLTMWLPEDQLSISVEGNTSKAMWAAFDQVRVRPMQQLYGHSADEDAAEAPITAKAR